MSKKKLEPSEDISQVKKLGRPKKSEIDEVVDEKTQERLDMEDAQEHISIEDLTRRWNTTFQHMAMLGGSSEIGAIADKWNKLNPFLQNQRIKDIYSRAKKFNKVNIAEFLESPGNHEHELRSLAWANSSSQSIYYNILRRSCDIPNFHYFIVPDLLSEEGAYSKEDFEQEDALV
mgnify:CR=1 FL=1